MNRIVPDLLQLKFWLYYNFTFFSDTPKRFFPMHWVSWIVSCVGIVMVLLAHGHYSVDVVIAYYVTTRLFWTYHILANNVQLKVSSVFIVNLYRKTSEFSRWVTAPRFWVLILMLYLKFLQLVERYSKSLASE